MNVLCENLQTKLAAYAAFVCSRCARVFCFGRASPNLLFHLFFMHSQLKSASASDIELTHTTPVHKYIDDVSFKFSGSGSACSVAVSGSST